MSNLDVVSKKNIDTWIKPYFKKYKKVLILALGLGLLAYIFAAALMFTSGYLITAAAEMPVYIYMIQIPLILVRVFGIGKPILHYFERLASHDWVLRMTSDLRLKLYKVIEKNPIHFKSKHTTGDVLGLLSEDIGHIQNLYLRTIFPTVMAWVLFILLLVFLGSFTLPIALALLINLGVVLFLLPIISVLANGAKQAQQKALTNELYHELTDNVLGVSDWIFAGRSKDYLTNYKKTNQKKRLYEQKIHAFARKRELVERIFFGLSLVSLIVWGAYYFGGSFGGSSNWIAAFVLGFFPLIEAFAPVSEAITEGVSHKDSIERLNTLSDADDAKLQKNEISELVEPKAPFVMEINDVEFVYPNDTKKVLNGVNLTVSPGEKIALLGRSGSGKSTMAALMRGDYRPSQGEVTLGGAKTADIVESMPKYVGLIQQDTYLFNTTLFENLRLGNTEASKDEVWAALDKVGLKSMTERLPHQLETLVDEAGMRFSGGERHRIALARVLLQDVPIVILDEPTVGLDPKTENELLATLFETLKDKTVIMITHHLQGVSHMDRVVFLEDGQIELEGTPDELKTSSSRYQKLLQFDKGFTIS